MNMKDKEFDSFQVTKRTKGYENLQFTVILVQPEHSGNIGSITRVMANFDFTNLIIFNPIEKVEKIFSYETQGFAMHGNTILMNAKVIQPDNQEAHLIEFDELLNKFDLVIATTAKGTRYTNIKRTAIFPEHLKLPISKKQLKIAILFGKESRGLTNEEIQRADILLRIPTHNIYPTLNISHACAIILYEIFKITYDLNLGRGKHPIILANRKDRQLLLKVIDNVTQTLKVRNYKQKKAFFAFRNVLERSLMTKKELRLILGVFSKINSLITNRNFFDENLN
jgi:tRNA/rRNA methyltransferase